MNRNELMREVQLLDAALLDYIRIRCSNINKAVWQTSKGQAELLRTLLTNVPKMEDFQIIDGAVNLTEKRRLFIESCIEPGTVISPEASSIKSLRNTLGLTQKQLAQFIQTRLKDKNKFYEGTVTDSDVRKLESGKVPKNLNVRLIIAWMKTELAENTKVGEDSDVGVPTTVSKDLGAVARDLRVRIGWSESDAADAINKLRPVTVKPTSIQEIQYMENGYYVEGLDHNSVINFLKDQARALARANKH
jgi:ribosome-binding protein aMBF1 (putative translation factor)